MLGLLFVEFGFFIPSILNQRDLDGILLRSVLIAPTGQTLADRPTLTEAAKHRLRRSRSQTRQDVCEDNFDVRSGNAQLGQAVASISEPTEAAGRIEGWVVGQEEGRVPDFPKSLADF